MNIHNLNLFDWMTYRKYILNGIDSSKYNIVSWKEIDKYKHFTTYWMQYNNSKSRPESYMIGYFIPTIEGKKWMPIFDHDYGRVRNRLNQHFLNNFKNIKMRSIDKKIKCLHEIGFPITCLYIIKKYLLIENSII